MISSGNNTTPDRKGVKLYSCRKASIRSRERTAEKRGPKQLTPMIHRFLPGHKTWHASDSPTSNFSAVFEDDGDTGYFYAYDRAASGNKILDAVHIYDASAVSDRDRESAAEIIWSADGMKAALLINDYPHAVINFVERCSYSRTGFPSPHENWRHGTWMETLMELFGDKSA